MYIKNKNRVWWPTLLIPALRREGQADLYEFEDSTIYMANFKSGLHNVPVSKIKTPKKQNQNKTWARWYIPFKIPDIVHTYGPQIGEMETGESETCHL